MHQAKSAVSLRGKSVSELDGFAKQLAGNSVTVVIPVFNGARFIADTVKSAAAQTHDRVEILAIDDGSTDDTPMILERLCDEIAGLRIIHTPNRGVAQARNLGTREARGDFVAYLDADDIWHPDKLRLQVAQMQRHADKPDWAGCYTLFRRIDTDGRVIADGPAYDVRGGFFASHMVRNHVGNGSSLLVRREAALAVGGFDPGYAAQGIGGCEDHDFQLRLLSRYKLDLVRAFLTGYRLHPDCMSADHTRMGLSRLAVTRSFADHPALPAAARREAEAAAHGYAWMQFAAARDWRRAATSFAAQKRAEGVLALQKLPLQAVEVAQNLLGRLGLPTAEPRLQAVRRVAFDTLPPTEGLETPTRPRETATLQRLAGYDRAFAEGRARDG